MINQPRKIFSLVTSIFLLLLFIVFLLKKTGINADAIYPFSLAKDLLTGISIKNWHFPGPYFIFPDVLVSYLILLFTRSPEIWAIAFAVLQLTAMVLMLSYFSSKRKSFEFADRMLVCVYTTILTYTIIGLLLHPAWNAIANKSVLPVHHFSTALIALLVLFTSNLNSTQKITLTRVVTLSIIVFAISYSDPFFVYLYAMLQLPYLFAYKRFPGVFSKWLLFQFIFAIAGIAGVALNAGFNDGFWVEFHGSLLPHNFLSRIGVNFLLFYKNMKWQGVVATFLLPILTAFFAIKQKKTLVVYLCISMICTSLMAIILGLFNDDLTKLRYIDIYFPVLVYSLYELLPNKIFSGLSSRYAILIGLLVIIGSSLYFYRHTSKRFVFEKKLTSLVACVNSHPELNNSVLIATYWSAKLVFENINRTLPLIQASSSLTPYTWISNPAWQYKYKRLKLALITTNEVDPRLVLALEQLPNAQIMCHGQLIRVPFQAKLFTLAPALKMYGKV